MIIVILHAWLLAFTKSFAYLYLRIWFVNYTIDKRREQKN